jgi:hypothetical protein
MRQNAGMYCSIKVKVKLSCYRHASAKGKMRYTSFSFLTSSLDGDEWSASRYGRALPPERIPGTTGQGAGWASELVWTQRIKEKSFFSAGDRNLIVQSVVRHSTDVLFYTDTK